MTVRTSCLLAIVLVTSSVSAQAGKPAQGKITSLEREIFNKVNAERVARKLTPLKLSAIVSNYARQHSRNMAEGKVSFSHAGSKERRREAAKDCGRGYFGGSENIAYRGKEDAAAVMNGWMNSPGHRKNILSTRQEVFGIGVWKAANGRVYYTQLFLKKKK